jgi:hypothetical protein
MKSINLPPLFFISNPLKAVNNNASSSGSKNQSPYLKAILSGTARSVESKHNDHVVNEDRQAALRYIKESNRLKK